MPMYCLPAFHRNGSKLSSVSLTTPANGYIKPMTCAPSLTKRRSGNYKPPLWTFDYIQSLSSKYEERKYWARTFELVKQVKKLLDEEMETTRQLELINDLKRLGICYHFEEKIDQILHRIYTERYPGDYKEDKRPLYSTALEFRLLREHGFNVPQDVFDCFKNEAGGDFDPSLADDAKGLLQLYEASFLSTAGEETLEMAKEFATRFLREKLDHGYLGIDGDLPLQVRRALELPTHWRVQRPNARWFINAYSTRPGSNPILLQLAKLDFNIVQATHLQDLKHALTWWKQTGLAETLPFARDRLVECYIWTLGWLSQPQYAYARIRMAKVNALVTVIDDIFDVYGTLEELELFNEAIQRWDIEAIEKLPHYMKICHLALNNLINEIAYDVLKEQGLFVINHLRKSWADLCASFLQEANWFSAGYIPKMEEYLSNGWLSGTTNTLLSHTFFLVVKPIREEAVESLYEYHNIIVLSGMLLRLANDMGTSSDEITRGDVPKSIECYMEESGASREEAREHVMRLIGETWKRMNEQVMKDSRIFPKKFDECAMDIGRMAQYMYQHGDGHGVQQNHPHIKEGISDLLFNPMV